MEGNTGSRLPKFTISLGVQGTYLPLELSKHHVPGSLPFALPRLRGESIHTLEQMKSKIGFLCAQASKTQETLGTTSFMFEKKKLCTAPKGMDRTLNHWRTRTGR